MLKGSGKEGRREGVRKKRSMEEGGAREKGGRRDGRGNGAREVGKMAQRGEGK